MKLFDTMTREVRELNPSDGKTFRFYACGPTVYGPAHIGNFRTFVLQDVFRRTLELSGIDTLHVRNFTDVDDKTIPGFAGGGKNPDRFHKPMARPFSRGLRTAQPALTSRRAQRR